MANQLSNNYFKQEMFDLVMHLKHTGGLRVRTAASRIHL